MSSSGQLGVVLPACVLIASKNGAAQIASTIDLAVAQCPTFVVSDGSTDDTCRVARACGAEVLDLADNIGKPAACVAAITEFNLLDRFHSVVIVDDDTALAPDFVSHCLAKMTDGVAIVVGHTESDWTDDVRWNPWVAARAFGYWKYQLLIRRGQSALNVMNCIAGSNSMIRSSVLAVVMRSDTPYIVDDTFWTLETHRRNLGRIVYAPKARAAVQDPTTLRSWYTQNLRWLWGTMQGVRGHRVGRHMTLFDASYVALMFDWFIYVVIAPILIVLLALSDPATLVRFLSLYLVGYAVWAAVGAVALRRWRLIPLFPALIVLDWIQRVNFAHAFVKSIREPTVERCVWSSPARYEAHSDMAELAAPAA